MADSYDYNKAIAVINNSIPPKDRHLYTVENSDDNPVVKASVESGSSANGSNVDTESIFSKSDFSWTRQCNFIQMFLSQLPHYLHQLQVDLERVEGERCDVEHFIEFSKLNAREGYKAYKLMHEVRLERRRIKDEIAKVNIAMDSALADYKSGKVVRRFNGLDNRSYEARVLKDLF